MGRAAMGRARFVQVVQEGLERENRELSHSVCAYVYNNAC